MKEEMIKFVCEHGRITKEEFLNKNWEEQVNYILSHLAGECTRWCIYKDFMVFMARFGQDCIEQDRQNGTQLAAVLFTVAMQRLSKGAVLHDVVNFYDQLPSTYWAYSSAHDDYHIMTPDCLEFIYKGLPVAANYEPTKNYARIIAWGLVEHLDAEGKRHGGFSLDCENPDEEGKKLFECARRIIEQSTMPRHEIFARYAKPWQWQKHKAWLKRFMESYNAWNLLYQYLDIPKGLKGRKQRHQVRREILCA